MNSTSRLSNALDTAGRLAVRAGLSWPLLFAGLFYLVWLYRGADTTLLDPDTYMHITIGHWILDHRAIPTTDLFSHTMTGAAWIPHEWLSDVLLALIHSAFGWNGLHILAVGISALTLAYVLRFQLNRSVPPIYAILFTYLAATCLISHLLARPHLFTWPILVYWFGSLLDAAEQRRAPSYWLSLLMMLWANLHGSFVLGLALVPLIAIEAILNQPAAQRFAAFRRWALFLLLGIGATLITPWTWKSLTFAYQLLSQPTLSRIDEWGPVSFAGVNAMEVWIMTLLALMGLGLLRLPPVRLLILMALLYEGLAHVRYMSIFGLLTPMLIALPFQVQYARFMANLTATKPVQPSALDPLFDRLCPPARRTTTTATTALLILIGALLCLHIQPQPPTKYTPAAALASAHLAGLDEGRVFNDYPFGGYLISQGIPVYIDGRADMYGAEFLQTYFDAISPNRLQQFGAFLDAHDIEWTLLPPNNYLVDYLSTQHHWQRIHEDDVAVVHRRIKP